MNNDLRLVSIPTVDLVRELIKREYVNSLLTSENIRVIMLPEFNGDGGISHG